MGVVLIDMVGRWRESGVWDKTVKKKILFWEVSKWMSLSRGTESTLAVVQMQNYKILMRVSHLERQ